MTPRLVLPLLLLAGCGGGSPAPPAMADGPGQAECRAEAARSPQVEDVWRQVVIGNRSSEERFRQARQDAETRAYGECLRRRGYSRGGGVEPLRRPGS